MTYSVVDSVPRRNLFKSLCFCLSVCILGFVILLDLLSGLVDVFFYTAELSLAKQSVSRHAEEIENLNKVLLEKRDEVIFLKQKLEEGECTFCFAYFSI